MRTFNYIKSTFTLVLILLISTAAKVEKDNCDRVIKYHVSKVAAAGQAEVELKMEVIVDPKNNNITIEFGEGRKKVTEIEVIECSLNKDLTTGFGLYKGIKKDPNGKVTTIKVEAKDGKIRIYNPSPETDNDKVEMTVDKWELVKN